jgi:hypothetical protein
MPPPQNQNTVAPEPVPTNQVNMISTNSPVLPLGQIAPPSIQGQFGNLPMVGGVWHTMYAVDASCSLWQYRWQC